ncbi:MAG: Rrf2 family transcriptional regulator [Candidatus Omnitrophica bacterium]|nr:Rrf2 family transcriptional regulator [Candidatus Omnitrophota bacterium]
MKLITRDTDYALRAICSIAKSKNKIVPVSELVKELKIPRPFLRKILQLLSKKKIFRSYKGSGGGFTLAVPVNKIYLLDLIKIFQGPIKLNECFLKRKTCPNTKRCALKKKINKIEKYMFKELRPVTVASLLAKDKEG